MRSWPFASVVGLAIPYGFLLATLYLFAHWRPVGLNPFQFANAADLVSATTAGLIVGLGTLVAGGIIGMYVSSKSVAAAEIAGPDKLRTDMPKNIAIIVVITVTVIVMTVIAWIMMSPFRWVCTGVVVAMSAQIALDGNKFFDSSFPHISQKVAFLQVAIILPFASTYAGERDIEKVLSGDSARVIDAARSEVGVNVEDGVRYVGMLGDFHILFEPATRSTIVLQSDARIVFAKLNNEKM
ncbi:hypothetical protein H5368_02155 [Luteimonas sp. MC1782]|uniref:hypothetical protein n=1 Tax=Luteimonas sp. MC1782 TaxID=2760305 RepID=UPI001603AFBE|nr:hypothetical protein [Luteimonas sp. MC1782]MBB1471827.1 hypothetical protein [Luteimonas sp. MC1782]